MKTFNKFYICVTAISLTQSGNTYFIIKIMITLYNNNKVQFVEVKI